MCENLLSERYRPCPLVVCKSSCQTAHQPAGAASAAASLVPAFYVLRRNLTAAWRVSASRFPLYLKFTSDPRTARTAVAVPPLPPLRSAAPEVGGGSAVPRTVPLYVHKIAHEPPGALLTGHHAGVRDTSKRRLFIPAGIDPPAKLLRGTVLKGVLDSPHQS